MRWLEREKLDYNLCFTRSTARIPCTCTSTCTSTSTCTHNHTEQREWDGCWLGSLSVDLLDLQVHSYYTPGGKKYGLHNSIQFNSIQFKLGLQRVLGSFEYLVNCHIIES